MKQVLVTGGAGFIGSHLTEALLARGDAVTVVDDQSTGTFDNLAAVREHPRLTCIEGDIGDPELAARLAADADHVYHLAAAVGVALVARQPKETIERNIHPTELLLDALVERCRSGDRVKFFLASTSEVYGKNPKATFHEEDDLIFGSTTRARWSYGASKAIDEFLALACHRQYGLPVVIGRFFNVVGPRQSGAYGMVLPRFVDAALAGRPLIVPPDAEGRVFNIGSNQPVSIVELAQRVIAATGSAAPVEYQSYADAYDADFEDIRRRVPDLTRLQQTIPHRNHYDLDAIIRAVIDAKTKQP